MNIFESLENLPVSEECFDEIMGLVEEILSEAENKNNKPINFRREQIAKRINQLMKSGEIDKVVPTNNGSAVIGDPDLANEINGYKQEIDDINKEDEDDDSDSKDNPNDNK